MTPLRLLILLALVATAAAFSIDRGAALGRFALRAGLPELGLHLVTDPAWCGIALHRAGWYERAEDAFRRAGPTETFNRANTLARAGRYREALAAYDAVLHRDPGDVEAAEDRALVASLYDGAEAEPLPGGEVAGDGGRDEGIFSPYDLAVAADGAGTPIFLQNRVDRPHQPALAQRRIRRGFADQSIAADRRWLATFPDDPARYLKALIAAEHERRRKAGLSPPDPVDRW